MIAMRGWVTPVWLLLFVMLLLVGRSRASVVVPMTLEQLAREARVIVDARVMSVHVTGDTGRLERVVSLRVLSRWKGEADDVVHVRLPGGTLGRTATLVPGAPTMRDAERFVLFLDDAPRGGYYVLGLYQGAWRVTPSTDGTMHVGPTTHAGMRQAGPVSRGDGSRRPHALGEFRTLVDGLLEGTR